MRLAVIPARGGSKRIPRKNIRDFVGKPMLAYAVDAAHASGLFDHVLVSTDDPEVAAIAEAAGAEVPFHRPAELADDITPTVPVIAHAIAEADALGWQAAQVCCIYPAVPLIEPDDICRTLDLLEGSGRPYAFPVAPFRSAIQRALRRDSDGAVRPFSSEYVETRTQDLEPAYHDAGQFYWGTAAAWSSGLNVHVHGSTIVLPDWRVVDIDTPEDWERAEAMFGALRRSV